MRITMSLLIAILLFSSCNGKASQKNQPLTLTSNVEHAVKNIDSLLKGYARYGRLSGTVLIVYKDSIWYENSFGLANFESQRENSNKSVYGIGSLTKTFTATAILKLVQDGRIDLTDNLATFFPALGETAEHIQIHHLLSMTSGIYEDFSRSKTYDIENIVLPKGYPISIDSLVHYFGELTSDSKPGKKFDYSNINYVLLSAIIEKVSGKSYRDFLAETFWQPLNMQSTNFGLKTVPEHLLSNPFLGLPTEHTAPEFWDDSWVQGAGGIFSSAYDIYKWMYSINNHTILDSINTSKLFKKHTSSYGYGWQIGTRRGNKYQYHEGGTLGYVCEAGFYPNLDLYVVVLTNHTHGIMEIGKTVLLNQEINREIQNILFNQPFKKLPLPTLNTDIQINSNVNVFGFDYNLNQKENIISISPNQNSPSFLDAPFKQELTENSKRFKKAQRIAQAFGEEDFKKIRRNGELPLRILISTKTLTQIWTELTGDKGEFISYNFYRIPCEKTPNSYWIRLIHKNKEVGLQIVLSKRGKIKGMHIDQQFAFNGPKQIEANIISNNHIFIDGFKHGYPDANIYKIDGKWVLHTHGREIVLH
jgi:CubicO group peptidase (beta-lactamase class C family)